MKHFRKALLLHAVLNALAAADGMGYAWLTMVPGMTEADFRVACIWALGTFALSFTIITPILVVSSRSSNLAIGAIREGRKPPADTLEQARRAVLALPVRFARVCMSAWLAGALLLIPACQFLEGDRSRVLLGILHGTLITILVGAVATPFIYYLWESYFRRYALPHLFPSGDLSAVPGAKPVSITFKVVNLLVTTCFLPITLLSLVAWVGEMPPLLIPYVGGAFLVVGAVQSIFICASVTVPLSRLAKEMRKVEEEDLTARADVLSRDDIGELSEGFNRMVAGLRRGEFVRETFGRYVTQQVMDEILNGRVALGGEVRNATVLFSDIRGFTALSERLRPDEIVGFLNRYLDVMVEVLVAHGGTIDKFIGDAILASFGVPVTRRDDAERAVRAAVAMVERLDELNVERRERGEAEIAIGIGLHSGDVVAGNIGSARKMEYTIIGDTVNTSSRIEQLNKEFGTKLLISRNTHDLVQHIVQARPLEPVMVKGKSRPVEVYEVTGIKEA